ncbi:MAG: hypothetical protein AAF633_19635 [Chloroflexota bacterium]
MLNQKKRKIRIEHDALMIFIIGSALTAMIFLVVVSISVEGRAIKSAEGATANAEVGPDDYQISNSGSDYSFFAGRSAVAFNSAANENLVVYEASGLENVNTQIHARRVDATTGQPLGDAFQISDKRMRARDPDIAYSPSLNRYLVVWEAKIKTKDKEIESLVYGAWVEPNGVTSTHFVISQLAIDLDPEDEGAYLFAGDPAVTFNPDSGQFYAVWSGGSRSRQENNDSVHIFGTLITTTGDSFQEHQISQWGSSQSGRSYGESPDVAYGNGHYLVTWSGRDPVSPMADGEYEIYARAVSTAQSNSFSQQTRISAMGGLGNSDYYGIRPSVAASPTKANDFFVAWQGIDQTPDGQSKAAVMGRVVTLIDSAQDQPPLILNPTYQLSHLNPASWAGYHVDDVSVGYDGRNDRYWATWLGSPADGPDQHLIWRIPVNENGKPDVDRLKPIDPSTTVSDYGIATNRYDSDPLAVLSRESTEDPDGETHLFIAAESELGEGRLSESDLLRAGFHGRDVDVAYNPSRQEFLAVWAGDRQPDGIYYPKLEAIFGQRIDAKSGEALDGPFPISLKSIDGAQPRSHSRPQIAYDEALDRYLVVWEEASSNRYYSQRLASDGTAIGEKENAGPLVVQHDFGKETELLYVGNRDDTKTYLLSWVNDDKRLYGMWLTAEGNHTNQQLLLHNLASTTARISRPPTLILNQDTGDLLLAWIEISEDRTPKYAKKLLILDSEGVAKTPVLPLSTGDAYAAELTAVYNGDQEEFLAAWRSQGSNGVPVIELQRVHHSGFLIPHAPLQIQGEIGLEGLRHPNLIYHPTAGRYLLSFEAVSVSSDDPFKPKEISGVYLDGERSEPVSEPFEIGQIGHLTELEEPGSLPSVAYDADNGHALVAWQGAVLGEGIYPSDQEIFGQLLDLNQLPSDGSDDSVTPTLTPDASASPTETAIPTVTSLSPTKTPAPQASHTPQPTADTAQDPTKIPTSTSNPTSEETPTAAETPQSTPSLQPSATSVPVSSRYRVYLPLIGDG